KPRAVPSGVASARMPRSGPFPANSSERRSSRLPVAARSNADVRARPSAAVAVGNVPCRTRASSQRVVVTTATPRIVPSAVSMRARRSAMARVSRDLTESLVELRRRDEADETLALLAPTVEQHVRRHAGYVEARHQGGRPLVLLGDVGLQGGERACRADDRRVPERRVLHLPAGNAPERLEVDQDGTAGGARLDERLIREVG